MFSIKLFSEFLLFIFIIIIQQQFCSAKQDILHRGSVCYSHLNNGKTGICKPAAECKWLEKELKSRRMNFNDIRKYHCSFEGMDEIICCPQEKKQQNPTNIISKYPRRPKNKNTTRISDIACKNYTTFRRPPFTYNIINGMEVLEGEFPHMAALGYEVNGTIVWRCGASLISERYLLTAAHCANFNQPQPIIVRLGRIDLISNITDRYALDVEIENIIRHPQYTSNKKYHDIALIKLKRDVLFNENVHPACLQSDQSDPPETDLLLVTGYGQNETRREIFSLKLLKANLRTFSLPKCKNTFAYLRFRLPNGILNSQLCAYDPAGTVDACQGDSGGPLQKFLPSEMPLIVGVTSFGYSCGSRMPAVYTRVAYYLDWIEKIVWG